MAEVLHTPNSDGSGASGRRGGRSEKGKGGGVCGGGGCAIKCLFLCFVFCICV